MSAKPVFWGMLLGAVVAGLMTWTGHKTVMGIHGGVIGLALNFLVAVVGSILVPSAEEDDEEVAAPALTRMPTQN
jgi:solute:Na+ symporter, SSS family